MIIRTLTNKSTDSKEAFVVYHYVMQCTEELQENKDGRLRMYSWCISWQTLVQLLTLRIQKTNASVMCQLTHQRRVGRRIDGVLTDVSVVCRWCVCRPTHWPMCWPTRRWDRILYHYHLLDSIMGKGWDVQPECSDVDNCHFKYVSLFTVYLDKKNFILRCSFSYSEAPFSLSPDYRGKCKALSQ